MSASVFVLVLAAAALHAGWNALVKRLDDPWTTAVTVAAAAAAIAALLLVWLPPPAPPSWPFIAISAALQLLYFALLAAAYRHSDMSRAYPLMRAGAVMLVALASSALLAESLAPGAWFGIGLICLGGLSMILGGGPGPSRAGIAFALLNAAVIAGYTLIDAIGVRRSQAPAAYTLWIFLLAGGALAIWALTRWPARWLVHVRRHGGLALIGGVASLTSYGLALWAMTQTAVATVAALRETSILFGMAIAALVLKERVSRHRIAAATAMAAGAIALRLA